MTDCRVCKVELIKDENWSKGIYRLGQRICKKCHTAKSQKWRNENRKRYLKNQREYREKNREQIRKKHRERYAKIRLEILTHYSIITCPTCNGTGWNPYWQEFPDQKCMTCNGDKIVQGKPKCSCCGENNLGFLTIDHINNDGAKDRRKHKSTWALFIWLKKNNYPEGYQILCYNCNMGRAYNDGVCPHNEF